MRRMRTPGEFIKRLLQKKISVELKWGYKYEGTLIAYDRHMNLLIDGGKETINGVPLPVGRTLLYARGIKIIRGRKTN